MKMSISKGFYLALISILLEAPGTTPFPQPRCTKDLDCRKDEFCYTVTYYCSPCEPDFCKQFDRKQSQKICPHEYTDCGPCLDGYEAEMIHGPDGFTENPTCDKKKVVEEEGMSKSEEDMSMASHVYVFIAVGIIVVATIIVTAAYQNFFKRRNPTQSSIPHNRESNPCNNTSITINSSNHLAVTEVSPPSASSPSDPLIKTSSHVTRDQPPSYNDSCKVMSFPQPSAPQQELKESDHDLPNFDTSKDTDLLMPERPIKEENRAVNAAPFRKPNYVVDESQVYDEEEDEEEEEGALAYNESSTPEQPISPEDEDTRECDWTPLPRTAANPDSEEKEDQEEVSPSDCKRRKLDE